MPLMVYPPSSTTTTTVLETVFVYNGTPITPGGTSYGEAAATTSHSIPITAAQTSNDYFSYWFWENSTFGTTVTEGAIEL
jgi:hypothetical protein